MKTSKTQFEYKIQLNLILFLVELGNNLKDVTMHRRIVIYITNAVGYILQREVFRLKHDRAARVFKKNRAM
jgi:hypothetical protein